jgi:type II restriction/modification system DNA methylase subunit YeeA
MDIVRRPSDTWLIDFGIGMSEADAALFEEPFAYVLAHVKPARAQNREQRTSGHWWLHRRSGEDLRAVLARIPRYICTPRVAKHRLFVWFDSSVFPDSRICVIARSDDTTLGILQSRIHEVWALANAPMHGDGSEGGRPTYAIATCFETFPFPEGMTPRDSANETPSGQNAERIATAARRLNELRDNWLNPPAWVDWVITPDEEEAGFPKRPIAKPGFEAELKKRALTNLYNQRPAWLDMAHKELDTAVATAYGWPDYAPEMPDEEILKRLLKLNQARS